jgi:hypothetical protein
LLESPSGRSPVQKFTERRATRLSTSILVFNLLVLGSYSGVTRLVPASSSLVFDRLDLRGVLFVDMVLLLTLSYRSRFQRLFNKRYREEYQKCDYAVSLTKKCLKIKTKYMNR